MPNTRISTKTRNTLRELSRKYNKSMEDIIEEAIDLYRRKRFLEEYNIALGKLRENNKLWQEEKEERDLWDNTLQDGLQEDFYRLSFYASRLTTYASRLTTHYSPKLFLI